MSTADKIVKNTGWLYAKMGITMFVSLWVTRIVLNSLGESDFGIFNVVGGAISMLGFLNAAMALSSQRFMSYAQGEGDESKQTVIFNVSIILHFAIAIFAGLMLLCAGFVFFNGVLDIPTARRSAAVVVYSSLVISTMFTVMTVPYDAVMNAHENMKYYAFVGILESLLKLSVAFCCLYFPGDKLIVYGVLMACIPLFTMTIMRVYCHRNYRECTISVSKYFNWSAFKEMTSFAGWNLLGTSFTMIGSYGMGIVLNSFFGTLLNSAHGVANQLGGQVLAFSNNMLKATNPAVAKFEGAGDRHSMLRVIYTGSKFSYSMIAVFSIPLIIEMPYVLKLWVKNVPDYAVIITQLVMARFTLEQVAQLLATAISAVGSIKALNVVHSVISIMALGTSIYAFHSGLGPEWMYVIYLIGIGIIVPISKIVIAHQKCDMPYKAFLCRVITPMFVVTVISTLSGLFVHGLMDQGFIRLLLVSVVCVVTYLVLLFFFGLDISEREGAIAMILSLRARLFS